MLTFNQLRAANVERAKEWDPEDKLSRLFYAVALAGEVGEACNAVKKMEREEAQVAGSRTSLSELGKELADIVIYADILARKAGINLGQAVQDKFNETSRKYGMKTRIE